MTMTGSYYQLPGGYVLALQQHEPFPPLEMALKEPNGLIAIGGDLSPERLLQAYRHGIFPWFSEGEPVLWWSPDPRMVLMLDELKVSRSLAKRLRKQDYEIRLDHDFAAVMHACASVVREGQNGTWITPAMMEAYCELHRMGYAHCIEVWMEGKLAGGLYGVQIGGMFYGESMFHRVRDASKIAFVHLVRFLQAQGCGMMDCQMHTSHLASLGAREIAREEFAARLQHLLNQPRSPERWFYDTP
jgi:leucyl/phenylalanyl-tRNA--protein transferase